MLVVMMIAFIRRYSYGRCIHTLMMLVNNFCSQSWALYALYMLCQCCYKDMLSLRLFLKFHSMSVVILISWCKSRVMDVLCHSGYINNYEFYEGGYEKIDEEPYVLAFDGHTPQQVANV